MTNKLPVGEVLNEAFQFGLHRWGAVLRFGWAPMLLMIFVLMIAIAAVFRFESFAAMEDAENLSAFKDILRVPVASAVLIGVAATMVMTFLFSGVMASIYRLVALGEDRPGLFHLRLDGPAIRVFWAYVILMLINYAVVGAAFLGALAVTGQSAGEVFGAFRDFFWLAMSAAEDGSEPDPAAIEPLMASMGVFGLAIVFALIPMFYVNVKLAPFLAGSAAENRLLLFGSFALTNGQFWPTAAALLLVGLLLVLVTTVFQLATLFFDLLSQLLSGQGGALLIVGGILSLIVLAASIVYQAFIYAVQFSTQAIIYRRLKTGQ